MNRDSRPVYSTEHGRLCPGCGKPTAGCQCKQAGRSVAEGPLRVSREKAGRGGRWVTLVRGLPLGDAALQQLGKQLKTACGSGGTVKDGVVEVQGDHVERVMAWLAERPEGFKPKRAGG